MDRNRLVNIGPFHFEQFVISHGHGKVLPNDFASCRILIRVLTQGSQTFPIGYDVDTETEVITGLGSTFVSCIIDLALQTMVEGDRVLIKISNSALCEVPLEVHLISFQLAEEVCRLSPDAKLARALQLKEIGTRIFKAKDNEVAFYKFSRALKYLLCIRNVSELPSEISGEITSLRCQCYLNISACQLQANSFISVADNCSKALKIDPSNIKGLFRRANAYVNLKEYEKARDDLIMAKSLEPTNSAVSKLLASVKVAMREETTELAKSMSKMFQ